MFTLNIARPIVMGILNVTPDSFSDGGAYLRTSDALNQIDKMIINGADIIDIGGESSRPGSDEVSIEEEWERIGEIIRECKKNFKIPISVDTYKTEVAKRALDLGVEIINDISGMTDLNLRKVCSEYFATVVVMHMQGKPKTMQTEPKYKNVVSEIISFLKSQVDLCLQDGIKNIILDPGIGFGKTLEHNLEILKNLERFKELKLPILLGVSRKSFLGKILELENPKDRDLGTHVVDFLGLLRGVDILRVHDVKGTKEMINIFEALK